MVGQSAVQHVGPKFPIAVERMIYIIFITSHKDRWCPSAGTILLEKIILIRMKMSL